MPIPELPPATGPNLPPFEVFPSEIPTRYPWPEATDVPLPFSAPTSAHLRIEVAPHCIEQLRTIPLASIVTAIR